MATSPCPAFAANFRGAVAIHAGSSTTRNSARRRRRSRLSEWSPIVPWAHFVSCFSCKRQVSAGPGAPRRFSPKLGFRFTEKLFFSAESSFLKSGLRRCDRELQSLYGLPPIFPARGGGTGFLTTSAASVVVGRRLAGRTDNFGRETGKLRFGAIGCLKSWSRVGSAIVNSPAGAARSGMHGWPRTGTMADLIACLATLGGATVYLQIFNELAKRDVIQKKLSRNLVHIGIGLVFLLFWPLFTESSLAPYLAALAPGANGVRVVILGLGLMENEAVVKSMSRDGDRRELLKGPLYYVLAVVVTTVCFWRTSPVGIVALVNLCAGDGCADIIGRKFGNRKLPYSRDKSVAGSVGFFVMSSLISMLYLAYFAAFGFLTIWPGTLAGVVLVSFVSAVVESLPISTTIDDNFTVPFTAIVFGMLLLPTS